MKIVWKRNIKDARTRRMWIAPNNLAEGHNDFGRLQVPDQRSMFTLRWKNDVLQMPECLAQKHHAGEAGVELTSAAHADGKSVRLANATFIISSQSDSIQINKLTGDAWVAVSYDSRCFL